MIEDGTFDVDAVSSPHDENLSLAYEVLLRQYREALTRIHVLEMEIRNLTNAFMQSASHTPLPSGPAITPPADTAAIVARLQALEDRSMQVQLDELEVDAVDAGKSPTTPELDQLAQLRVQNHSLESRLAKMAEQLDETRQGRTRSRRNGNGRHRSSSKSNPLNRLLGR